jgi:hypothetical protein
MVKFKFWQKKPKPDQSDANESVEKDYEKKYQAPEPTASETGNLYEDVAMKPTRNEKA